MSKNKLFKKGNSLSRANAILSKHNLQGGTEEPATAVVVEQEQQQETIVEDTTAPVTNEEVVVEEVQENKENIEVTTTEEEATVVEAEKEEVAEIKEVVNIETPELTDDAVFSYLSEKLNRKIESVDDLTPKEKEIDPEVQQLLEWKERTKLSLSNWSEYNRDFSKLTDLDITREILAKKNPSFTQEELDYKLRSYVYDEDMDDDSDKIKKSIALKEFAQLGRKQLEDNKVSFKEQEKQIAPSPSLTQEQQENLTFAEKFKANLLKTEANQKNYNENLNKAALSLTGLNLKLTDDLNINFDISDGDKKTLPQSISQMPHWKNEDGSINHTAIAEDGVKVLKFNSIMEQVFQQGIAVGKEEIISGKTKTDLTPNTENPGSPAPKKGNIEQVIANLRGGKSKLRYGRVKK